MAATRRLAQKAKEFVLYRFLIAVLRRSFKKTPMYSNTLKAAKAEYWLDTKGGGQVRRVHFQCAECKRWFHNKTGSREIAVDHIEPVIDPERGFEGYDVLVERLFNGPLQVLCNYKGERDGRKSCHYYKTQKEREILKETKRRLQAEGKSTKTVDR